MFLKFSAIVIATLALIWFALVLFGPALAQQQGIPFDGPAQSGVPTARTR